MTADDIARATPGVTVFSGTNIPTTGFTSAQVANYERRLAGDIADQNWEGANDVLYGIALERGKMAKPEGWKYTKPGGDVVRNQFEQGNPYIGMLQSDMYTLTDPRATSWAQTVGGGQEDKYPVRDAAGNLTGNVVKFNPDGSSYVTSSVGGPGQRGLGGAGEYLTTPYTRPALQDWSNIMPEAGLLTTPAQRAIVANQGANYQPWAQGGLIEYSPAGTAAYVPRTYTTTPLGDQTTTTTTTDNGYTGPLGNQWDSYHDWYMADRPEIAGLVTTQGTTPLGGHQAAMNRLYANAGGQGLWGSYDAWFKSPRGDAYNAKVSDYKAGQ